MLCGEQMRRLGVIYNVRTLLVYVCMACLMPISVYECIQKSEQNYDTKVAFFDELSRFPTDDSDGNRDCCFQYSDGCNAGDIGCR